MNLYDQNINCKNFQGTQKEWDNLIKLFNGNYRQSYFWGEFKKSIGYDLYRLILKKNENIAATVQLVVKKFWPFCFVYIPGGISETQGNYQNCIKDYILSSFKSYIVYIRFDSNYIYDEKLEETLRFGLWSRPKIQLNSNRTIIHNLNNSTNIINNASSKWRYNYRRSLRNGIEFLIENKPNYKEILNIILEMQKDKGSFKLDNMNDVIKIMKFFKNQIIIIKCLHKGKAIGFYAAIVLDKRSWYFFSAQTKQGRKLKTGYPLLIYLLNECKKKGASSFDFGSIDHKNNPGIANYKLNSGGNIIHYIGEWEFTKSNLLKLFFNYFVLLRFNVVNLFSWVKKNIKQIKKKN